MIISASRRTDLPAFFPEKTIKDILKICKSEQTSIIPSKIPQHGVVFWTKNPEPIIPYLHLLDKNNIVYYFQYTYNNYPELEPNVPTVFQRMTTYGKLGNKIGFDKIKIRFDPILITNTLSLKEVLNRYYNLSYILRKETEDITFSFVDHYAKIPQTIRTLTNDEMSYAIDYLVKNISPRFQLYTCAENINHPKILRGKCIDPDMFIKMGMKIDDVNIKDTTQRILCKCYPSKDIGEYHTCKHNCTYCYAK